MHHNYQFLKKKKIWHGIPKVTAGHSIVAWVKGRSRTCASICRCERLKLSWRSEHALLRNIHTWEKNQIKQTSGAFSTVIVVMTRLLLTLLLRINSWRVWHSPGTSGCPVNNTGNKKTPSLESFCLYIWLGKETSIFIPSSSSLFFLYVINNTVHMYICLYIHILVLVERGCVYYWLTGLLPW